MTWKRLTRRDTDSDPGEMHLQGNQTPGRFTRKVIRLRGDAFARLSDPGEMHSQGNQTPGRCIRKVIRHLGDAFAR